jgi:hypothetical protein
MFGAKVIWHGVVTVFEIQGHPRANRCFAWGFNDEADNEFVTVLEMPPIFSARDAVRAEIISEVRSGKYGVPPSHT